MKQKILIFVIAFFAVQISLSFAGRKYAGDVPKLDGKIKIDGRMDETEWKKALVLDVNTEVQPGENVPAPVRTKCYIFYTKSVLYVGFKSFDPDPGKIRAHITDRDRAYQDDFSGIIIDTFNDKSRGYEFFVNPLGVQMDGIMSDGGREEDESWDAIWNSAGKINGEGYVVEMAIPFSVLQFQKGVEEQRWGFAAIRSYPRDKRHQILNFPLDRGDSCALCQGTEISGFSGVKPGKNIEIDPTVTGLRSYERDDFPDGKMERENSMFDLGISGRWGFSKNMTLSAAINPDFSQVEADTAQLDINNQFALYYDEKRPFFLEGSDFFRSPMQALYTRSIADPEWGFKLSGKPGNNSLGFFVSRDNLTNILIPGAEESDFTSLDDKNFSSVLRYKKNLKNSSYLGMLVTDREGSGYYNRVGGVDGLLRFSKTDSLEFQLLGSSTLYPENVSTDFYQKTDGFSGYAGRFFYSHRARSHRIIAGYFDFSPGFRADLGFIPQVDYKKWVVGGGYTFWGKKDSFLTSVDIYSDYDRTTTHDGALLESEWEARIQAEGPWQSFFLWDSGTRKRVYLGVPFTQWFHHFFFRANPSGTFNFYLGGNFGDGIDYSEIRAGKNFTFFPGIGINAGDHIRLSLNHTYSLFRINNDTLFRANLSQIYLYYHFNKNIFIRGIIQYSDVRKNEELYTDEIDPVSKNIFTQFLFSYKLNPRTVLFLGYSDISLAYKDIALTREGKTFFIKIGYALNI